MGMVKLKIIRTGTSRGVIIPKKLLDELRLDTGDYIQAEFSKIKSPREGWAEKFEAYYKMSKVKYNVDYSVTYPSGIKITQVTEVEIPVKCSDREKYVEALLRTKFYVDVDINIIKLELNEI